MNNKINYRRVRRIKNVIYAVIILLFLVPAVLLIWLGFKMLNLINPLSDIIAQNQPSYAQTAPPQDPGRQEGSGLYIMESSTPEEQLPVPESSDKPEPEDPSPEPSEPEMPFTSDGAGGVDDNSPAVPEPTGSGGTQAPGGATSPPPQEEPSQIVTYPPYGTTESPNTGMPRKGE